MHKLTLLLALVLATLIGCTTQLRPNSNIQSYYVTVQLQQSPALLCGVTPKGEACVPLLDGPKVKNTLNGNIRYWLNNLQAKGTAGSQSGSSVYPVSKEQGVRLLQALVADIRHREFERWAERYNDDDWLFDRL